MGKSTHVKISANANKGKWKIKSEIPGPGSYDITLNSIGKYIKNGLSKFN